MYSEPINGMCPKTNTEKTIFVDYIPTGRFKNPSFDIKYGFHCKLIDPFKGQTCEFAGADFSSCPIFQSAPGRF